MELRRDYEIGLDNEIAGRLPTTWPAFFGRFGRLTPVQRATIPSVLATRSVVICAPTASGKTEAAVAPLVERNATAWREWTILYVSPTRALVNDLYERLSRPLSELQLRLKRRTGDHHDAIDAVPNVLLTTPESFDSLLCRGRRDGGHALAHVHAVVLDEIHLLFGTPRGEQVRWLLTRLRRLRRYAEEQGWVKNAEVQVVGLSATVADAEALLAAYAPRGDVMRVRGGREIETVACDAPLPCAEVALPALLAAASSPEKVLVFCNARRRVDLLARELEQRLEGLDYRVCGHHGSLAVKEREATEHAVRTSSRVVVVATSTLEIGIDIGDIDLVVLDGPAPDVAALLQRIGRGNRRTNLTRVMACAGSMAEVLVQDAMIGAARAGELGPPEHGPQYAVARQQLASFIFQSPRRERSRGQMLGLIEECLGDEGAGLLDHLVVIGDLVEEQSGIRLGESWADACGSGEIHSNIEGRQGQTVQDEETGDEIAVGIRFQGGQGLSIAAQMLEVRGWEERRLQVRRVKARDLPEGAWTYVSRAWVEGSSQPWAVRRYLAIPEDVWPVLPLPEATYVFHLGGARRRAVLDMLVRAAAPDTLAGAATSWYLVLPAGVTGKPPWLTSWSAAALDVGLGRELDQLERLLGRPRANAKLPIGMRVREVREWLRLSEQLEAITKSRWDRVRDDDLAEALACLVGGTKSPGGKAGWGAPRG